MDTIEDIILQHSQRGMTVLRPLLAPSYCTDAARSILSWKRGSVIVTTGFFVNGHPETDGPLGALVLARALQDLGFDPLLMSGPCCCALFSDFDVRARSVKPDLTADQAQEILDEEQPVGLISVERCGINANGEYANMRGESIAHRTAALDLLFTLSAGRIPSVAVGDGGNEIGMGNLRDAIEANLDLAPCTVCVDDLVIASVSNWGAYGIVACLEELSGKELLPGSTAIGAMLSKIVSLGAVDGISRTCIESVDGFPVEVGSQIVDQLLAYLGRS